MLLLKCPFIVFFISILYLFYIVLHSLWAAKEEFHCTGKCVSNCAYDNKHFDLTWLWLFPREVRVYIWLFIKVDAVQTVAESNQSCPCQCNGLSSQKSEMVDEVEIPVRLTGDAAYPLRKWLMKGFTQHHQLSQEQAHYTHTLSSARMVVENAFGRLKGRCRCLKKRNDIKLTIMPNVVAACCILHNMTYRKTVFCLSGALLWRRICVNHILWYLRQRDQTLPSSFAIQLQLI